MELVIDLERVTVVLRAPEDLGRLSVRIGAPADASAGSETSRHRLADVLVAANVGSLDAAGHALIRPDAVRFHAAGQVPPGWEAGFEALCAATMSRTEPADGAIRAPVIWPPSRPVGD